jgi:glycosyltransferase involved in cell wall biosynthesis
VFLNVLFLPDYSRDNPYQNILQGVLSDVDVTVQFGQIYRGLPMLFAIQNHGKPQIVHIHWTNPFWVDPWLPISIFAGSRLVVELYVIKLLNIKIVWTIHNLQNHEQRFKSLEHRINRRLCGIADQIIVHCECARELVMNRYNLSPGMSSKITVIPHGHFIDIYANTITRSVAREYLGLSQKDLVFLYFGKIRNYKGVPDLISDFMLFKVPDAKLLIVGQPDNGIIQTKIKHLSDQSKKIAFYPGFIPNEDIQKFMNAADIVILPFKDTLTSGTVILAMSFSKPIIAPRLGCLAELLEENANFLYPPDGKNRILEALIRSQNANLSVMGEQNFKRVKTLDWTAIGHKIRQVYESCLK